MANNSFDYKLQSLDVFNKYISLLLKEQEEFFKHLIIIEGYHRNLSNHEEWNDKNHDQFGEDFIVDIQRKIHATINSYELATERLKSLKNQYSQVIN